MNCDPLDEYHKELQSTEPVLQAGLTRSELAGLQDCRQPISALECYFFLRS